MTFSDDISDYSSGDISDDSQWRVRNDTPRVHKRQLARRKKWHRGIGKFEPAQSPGSYRQERHQLPG